MRKTFSKGFTLIELLVVIAIIGILASIVLVSLNSARTKSRDANRVASLQEMAKAISVADDGSSTAIAGCITAGVDASTCTGPTPISFTNYKDPSTSGTVCTETSTAPCQYIIGSNTAVGTAPGANANYSSYKICTVLETGNKSYNGAALTNGLVHVGTDTGGSVVAGC